MVRKSMMAATFAAGYVLGARAGRDRYDAIVAKAQELWRDPRVQDKVSQAQDVAKEKANQVQAAAKEKLPGTSGSGTSGSASASTPAAGTGSESVP